MDSGIYIIVNKKNGRCYYGSSIHLKFRKYHHFYQLEKNIHDNPFLQHDYNKCGKEFFMFAIIEQCLPEDTFIIEQWYLNKYFDNQKMCYNINPNAENFSGFSKHTEETKKFLSDFRKGTKASEETKRKISESLKGNKRALGHINIGRKCSEECKRKTSEANKGNKYCLGRKCSEETRKKMSESLKKHHALKKEIK